MNFDEGRPSYPAQRLWLSNRMPPLARDDAVSRAIIGPCAEIPQAWFITGDAKPVRDSMFDLESQDLVEP